MASFTGKPGGHGRGKWEDEAESPLTGPHKLEPMKSPQGNEKKHKKNLPGLPKCPPLGQNQIESHGRRQSDKSGEHGTLLSSLQVTSLQGRHNDTGISAQKANSGESTEQLITHRQPHQLKTLPPLRQLPISSLPPPQKAVKGQIVEQPTRLSLKQDKQYNKKEFTFKQNNAGQLSPLPKQRMTQGKGQKTARKLETSNRGAVHGSPNPFRTPASHLNLKASGQSKVCSPRNSLPQATKQINVSPNTETRGSDSSYKPIIQGWFPNIESESCIIPREYMNRVSYSVECVLGTTACARILREPSGQSLSDHSSLSLSRSSSCSSSSVHRELISRQSSSHSNSGTNSASSIFQEVPATTKPTSYQESVLRDDRAQQHVHFCLKELAKTEICFVIFRLPFFYVSEKCQGDWDVLIIHQTRGIIVGEIKSVTVKSLDENEMERAINKIKKAILQLERSKNIAMEGMKKAGCLHPVVKSLIVPNIESGHLRQILGKNPELQQKLCTCLEVEQSQDPVPLCLCADQLSSRDNISCVTTNTLDNLRSWLETRLPKTAAPPQDLDTYKRLVAIFYFSVYAVPNLPELHLQFQTEGQAVSAIGDIHSCLTLHPSQLDLLTSYSRRVFITGPCGTGKTVVLALQGLKWLSQRHAPSVHIVSTKKGSLAVSTLIYRQLSGCRANTEGSAGVPRLHSYEFEDTKSVDRAVADLMSETVDDHLYVIVDEAGPEEKFKEFCKRLASIPLLHLWAATVHRHYKPEGWQEARLDVPLRSPPIVVREVMKSRDIREGSVYNYDTNKNTPFTDGPQIKRLLHNNQKGHSSKASHFCWQCGRNIAQVLRDLGVGLQCPEKSSDNPPLQYRDVLVLCHQPFDNKMENGRCQRTASGLVQGLRACQHSASGRDGNTCTIAGCPIPVFVVENEATQQDIQDMALAARNEVTVAHWSYIHGLERKLVVITGCGHEEFTRLYLVSRCTSQLVWIDPPD